MIKFVCGPSGSGKSTYIYNRIIDDLKNNKKTILIVPDQQVLFAERIIADMTDGNATFSLEILSFSRLANHVFRTLGGLSFNNIDEGGRLLIMWRAINEISPFLEIYKNNDETNSSFVELMMSTVDELKQFSISPATLEIASGKLKEKHPELSKKLSDISLIYGTYQSFVTKEYNDPTDELTRLSEKLQDSGFFAENNVYFDSFDGFTPQQYSIISHIAEQAQNVTFSLCCDMTDKTGIFKTTEKTYKNLSKLANKLSKETELMQLEEVGYESEDIRYVSKNLWNHSVEPSDFDGSCDNVNTVCCHDIFEECEAVVSDIIKTVRNGERYKNILVIARDITEYEGIIDTELENNGVPFYMSKRTDITTKPVFKLILAALAIKTRNWRFSDVISYVKTGLAGLSYEECNILENYASAWNINGSRWYDGIDWNMNPDGFAMELTDEGRKLIEKANELRNRVVTPLVKFFDNIGKTTVLDITRGLYDFLCELSVKEKIEHKAAQCRKDGNISEEKELVQLWNILINALDMMVDITGDMQVNGEKYFQLLSMLLSKKSIGTIPANIDQVVLGSASNLRMGNVSCVYLLGVNEGVFPKSVKEDSIFSDNEKNILKGIDVELNPDSDEKTADELYWFYRSISSARKKLTLLFSESDLRGSSNTLSVAGSRVNYLLGEKPIIKYADLPVTDTLEGRSHAIKKLSLNKANELGIALREYFSDDEKLKNVIDLFGKPLDASNEEIDLEIASQIYRGNISSSQSRIESYVKCPFEYHCRHILKLKEQKTAVFRSNDIGTFVHTVLERFMSKIANENGINTEITDDEIIALVDEIINEYINVACAGVPNQRPRLLQLFARLKKTTLLLIQNILEEFRQSDFSPTFFELPVMAGVDEGIEPYEVCLDDGTKLFIRGYVDRVDTYKKDDDVYVRIVDYKTGTKTFSLDDVKRGLNLQMLLYLFAIWNTKSRWFKERIGCEGEIYPAGILYFPAKAPDVNLASDTDAGNVYNLASREIKRKGLLLNDIDILRAMDKELRGAYIPVKFSKKDGLSKEKNIQTLEEFGRLSEEIGGLLNKIVKQMKQGDVRAVPIDMKDKKDSPCMYCKMKPICRKVGKGDDNE